MRTTMPCRDHVSPVVIPSRSTMTGWLALVLAVLVALGGALLAHAAPAAPDGSPRPASGVHLSTPADPVTLLNRVTWGASASSVQRLSEVGAARFLAEQLHPDETAPLPAPIQAQIDAMTIAQQPVDQIVMALEQRYQEIEAMTDLEAKKTARQAYQQELTRLGHEAATRALLRALYAPQQLHEVMTWFWLNAFSVYQKKHNIRAMLGDYADNAIRAHALGQFRALLAATVQHPAMLRYLDNERNAAGRLNENYARELLELHTLGVNGGYSQQDVQELARILTGLGVQMRRTTPPIRPALQRQYVRQGLFEFNPQRHDYGDKVFLGRTIKGQGLAEVEEVLDLLSTHPATARFVSRKLALYFVADTPSEALVERLAQSFLQSHGNIAATLRTLFESPEFVQSLGNKFKDPIHYVLSAVRLIYDDQPIHNPEPLLTWLHRMGESLYDRQTPDGYPFEARAWTGSGQMTIRFDIARTMGSGNARLFTNGVPQAIERPAVPQLSGTFYTQALQKTLSQTTQHALAQASTPQEWNLFLLASPEFMHR